MSVIIILWETIPDSSNACYCFNRLWSDPNFLMENWQMMWAVWSFIIGLILPHISHVGPCRQLIFTEFTLMFLTKFDTNFINVWVSHCAIDPDSALEILTEPFMHVCSTISAIPEWALYHTFQVAYSHIHTYISWLTSTRRLWEKGKDWLRSAP